MTGPGEQGGESFEQDVSEPFDAEMPHYEMTSDDVDAFAQEQDDA